MAERSFAKEVQSLRLGAGAEFRGEGILAVTKALLQSGRRLCRRLPGRADLPPDGRARRCRGHPDGARRAFRGQRLGSHRRRHARRLHQLPAARRGHVEVHGRHQRRLRRPGQPRLRGSQGRRAHHRRRGLRRRREHHAGAHPRLRHEVADLAARSAAAPAGDRAGGGAGVRAVRGQPHAGDVDAAHPRLPRLRALHREGQPAPALLGRPTRCARRRGTTAGSSCRPPPTRRSGRRSSSASPPPCASSPSGS